MGELRFQGYDHAVSQTPFGIYHAGFNNYPIWSDIGSDHGEPNRMVTVYWSKLGKEILYRGFDVNEAFAAMEEDYQMKKAGSLQTFGGALRRFMG